jgi:hypothetical protein
MGINLGTASITALYLGSTAIASAYLGATQVYSSVSAFDPTTLFTGTDTGWVYDLSDMSTLFQDAAGTTPVTAVGQPVGLELDKSKGLVLGPELVTNGTFDTDLSGWTAEGSNTIAAVNGELEVTLNSALFSGARSTYLSALQIGKTYKAEVTARRGTTGSGFIVRFGAAVTTEQIAFNSTTSETRQLIFTATQSTTIVRVLDGSSSGNGTLYIDNISVRELPGNHRTQSTALNRPTYQVDENGNYYLSYDGVNDSLATASFAWGTDKATVVAGVRKLSDAARGTLVEHTASIASNNGGFHLTAPNAASATFAFESKGTTLTDAVASGVAAPVTSVLTGIGDIAGDSAIIRLDGSVVDTDTGDQGSGNYASAVNHFGARAGTSLFFNGREYSNVGINRLLTTDELAALESWTAGKNGVTL